MAVANYVIADVLHIAKMTYKSLDDIFGWSLTYMSIGFPAKVIAASRKTFD